MADLRQKINKGRDVRLVIEARRRDRPRRYHSDDDSDRFPAFTTNITNKSYPKDFKPIGIPKYDGKCGRTNLNYTGSSTRVLS
jgi:hypothetical protein